MDIITRAEANLPTPPSTLTRHTGPWPGITWHHTGGNYTTWRAIYDWQVIQRPADARLPYIGYSYGISNGRVTELRGWDYRPAGDHDNDRLQVCFMGTWDSKLPPAADLAAAQEFLAWATARNGRPLPGTPHRDVWPAGHRYDTDCPGDTLTAWVKAHLITGDDMATVAQKDWDALIWRVEALVNGRAAVAGGPTKGEQVKLFAHPELVANLGEILTAAKDDGDTTVVLPPEALAQLDELHTALTALPPLVADAVADEQAARMAG